MDYLFQSFQSGAANYKGGKENLTEVCRVWQSQKDESALCHLACKCYPYLNKYRAKVLRSFGQEELDESFMHAITYAANHFRCAGNAKFETFFVWCLNSTVQQLFASSNAMRNKVNYGTSNLDDFENILMSQPERSNVSVNWVFELFDETKIEGETKEREAMKDARKLLQLILQEGQVTSTEACVHLGYLTRNDKQKSALLSIAELQQSLKKETNLNKALREKGACCDTARYDKLMTLVRKIMSPYKSALLEF